MTRHNDDEDKLLKKPGKGQLTRSKRSSKQGTTLAGWSEEAWHIPGNSALSLTNCSHGFPEDGEAWALELPLKSVRDCSPSGNTPTVCQALGWAPILTTCEGPTFHR